MTAPTTNDAADDGKLVMFFDIDNCLYSRNSKIQDMAAFLIDQYFRTHLSLTPEEASSLRAQYRIDYGIALQGLVANHHIDPIEYNAKVDDALPLEAALKFDPELRALFEAIDRDRVVVWLFTNAYITHAQRVVRLLGVEDLVDGLTYCDYTENPLVCKPDDEMFRRALRGAGVSDISKCFFVDDSFVNCKRARELGWTAAHLVEDGLPSPATPASQFQISHLRELPGIFPQIFKPGAFDPTAFEKQE